MTIRLQDVQRLVDRPLGVIHLLQKCLSWDAIAGGDLPIDFPDERRIVREIGAGIRGGVGHDKDE